jgi:hypothetical protein
MATHQLITAGMIAAEMEKVARLEADSRRDLCRLAGRDVPG